ncbi:MAG TPA: hypothetical protein VLF69_00155 [Candidatus Saccharimonadales bacterium]|nr:hypothetical protein [Candidatus Saccharimonadales bacterium]
MKKSNLVVTIIVILAILAGGGYMLLHKSSKPSGSTGGTSSKTTTAPAVNNAVLKTKTDATVGQYLTDPSGKALYTYASDTSGVSNCTGSCLANWPAYAPSNMPVATTLPTDVAVITRSDGKLQYTYQGMPLYYFTADSNGQVTGDGVENFKAARPAAASSSATPSNTDSSSSDDSGSPGNGYSY